MTEQEANKIVRTVLDCIELALLRVRDAKDINLVDNHNLVDALAQQVRSISVARSFE